MKKWVGSGVRSGSISQRYGSAPKCHGSPTLLFTGAGCLWFQILKEEECGTLCQPDLQAKRIAEAYRTGRHCTSYFKEWASFRTNKQCCNFLTTYMGARNRVDIGLSYRPARLHRLAESISIPGLLKSLNIRANFFLVIYNEAEG